MTLNIAKQNQLLENMSPSEILEWAWNQFKPKIIATSSFQTQSLPLLHLISQFTPDMNIFFLNTGFHFPETLVYRDMLINQLGLKVKEIKPCVGLNDFNQDHEDLHRSNPDLCCYINKVKPLQNALLDINAWITGIRRDQTPERKNIQTLSQQTNSIYKISPLANWTNEQINEYIYCHSLPPHPLREKGYMSIGCSPCTRVVSPSEKYRDGRWPSLNKTECGIHLSVNHGPNGSNVEFEYVEKNK